ncbi:MAG: 16S rRNA (cytidine(1402)-2'-O)-methyltransferase, partial [Smithellaceae bacterium]|nr:16S rRNA (cytidine(1402)-2'-O)-methyltransferase [Smithellaceae bacterium]
MNRHDNGKKGILYMVATPIGNLEDITMRALRVLKEVDLIAAEDTRHSRILLSAYDIRTPLVSLHEHNERERSALMISKIVNGMSIAYVSDAGTPCVSDPGYHLAAAALENGIRVVPIPGPSAVIAALSVSGFPADQFLFYGFLPPKSNRRRLFLESIRDEEQTLIFYESPARIADTMQEIHEVLGDRQAVVARELTKVYEEIRRGKVSDIAAGMSGSKARGEFTSII